MDHKCMAGPDIVPVLPTAKLTFKSIMDNYSKTCFEARNVADGAHLLGRMINEGDTIWLGLPEQELSAGLADMS